VCLKVRGVAARLRLPSWSSRRHRLLQKNEELKNSCSLICHDIFVISILGGKLQARIACPTEVAAAAEYNPLQRPL